MNIPLHILGQFCPPEQRDQLAQEWLDARTKEFARLQKLDADYSAICKRLEASPITPKWFPKLEPRYAPPPAEGTKMRRVLDAINGHPVSSRDLVETLPDVPRSSIASYLCQLEQSGHLRKVTQGVYERVKLVAVLALATMLVGCASEPYYGPLPTVWNPPPTAWDYLPAPRAQAQVTLAWNPVTNAPLLGYNVYVNGLKTGTTTNTQLAFVQPAGRFTNEVTAFNTNGLESARSEKLIWPPVKLMQVTIQHSTTLTNWTDVTTTTQEVIGNVNFWRARITETNR